MRTAGVLVTLAVFLFLLPYAEVLEDVVEGVLTGDASTEDAVERIDDGVEVFGNKITTEV